MGRSLPIRRCAALALGLALAARPGGAQAPLPRAGGSDQTAAEIAVLTAEADRRLFAAQVDGLMAELLDHWPAPGAVVAVVEEGSILLLKGYGFADRAKRTPVDGESTVFHVASLSKPVTASAVLQLADQGRIDLDRDLSQALTGVYIDPTFSSPVTARHLLTHTGGFDERSIGRKTRDPDRLLPLAVYLQRRLPPRIRPAGRLSVYSNHGYALLGLLVEEASGRPFADYMRENIFRPLEMARSAFGPSPELEDLLATGHGPNGDPIPPDYIQTGPASMLWTTGRDMSRWMLAVLEGGALGDRRILSSESARQLVTRQFSNHPSLPGRSFGLSEGGRFQQAEFLHAGGAAGFTSALVLLPAYRAGVFVSFNGPVWTWSLVNRLLDRYAELKTREAEIPSLPAGFDIERFSGYYRSADLSYTTAEKLAALVGQERVRPAGPGAISWRGRSYQAVGSLLFQQAETAPSLGFIEEDGMIRYLVAPGVVQEKLGWHQARPLQLALWSTFALIFLAAAVVRPGGRWPRRSQRLAPAASSRPVWPSRLARLASILQLLFMAALALLLSLALGKDTLQYGIPTALYVVMTLPLVAGALTALATLAGLVAWLRGRWYHSSRWPFLVLVLTLLSFLPFLASWNLLGYRF